VAGNIGDNNDNNDIMAVIINVVSAAVSMANN